MKSCRGIPLQRHPKEFGRATTGDLLFAVELEHNKFSCALLDRPFQLGKNSDQVFTEFKIRAGHRIFFKYRRSTRVRGKSLGPAAEGALIYCPYRDAKEGPETLKAFSLSPRIPQPICGLSD